MTRIPALLLASAIGISLSACKKDDKDKTVPPAPTRLDVKVVDETGSPVNNLEIKIYRNQEDWSREQNVAQRTTTSGNGNATFLYLDGTEYFVDASSGNKSNWEGVVRLMGIEPSQNHYAQVSMAENRSRLLSRAEGKTWRIISFKENNTELMDDTTQRCRTDNLYTFYKGSHTGRFVLNEGSAKCAPATPQLQNGTWEITAQGNMQINYGPEQQTYMLEWLSGTTLRLQKQEGNNQTRLILTAQ